HLRNRARFNQGSQYSNLATGVHIRSGGAAAVPFRAAGSDSGPTGGTSGSGREVTAERGCPHPQQVRNSRQLREYDGFRSIENAAGEDTRAPITVPPLDMPSHIPPRFDPRKSPRSSHFADSD